MGYCLFGFEGVVGGQAVAEGAGGRERRNSGVRGEVAIRGVVD